MSLFAAAIFSFMTGLNLPMERSDHHKDTEPPAIIKLLLQPRQKQTSLKIEALIGEQDKSYQEILAQLREKEKAKTLRSSLPAQFQGKTIEQVEIPNQQKVIALTFDDGPWPETTNHVLYVLKKNAVKATFFVVGKNAQRYPNQLKKILENGHAIGNHTWNHHYNYHNSPAAAREIDNTAALIYKITGFKTTLFRPPGGILDNGLANYAGQKNYAVIMWSADPKDWHFRSTSTNLIKDVVNIAQPGGIILLHDGGGERSTTVQALPILITELKKRGYKFVTVPELLEMATNSK